MCLAPSWYVELFPHLFGRSLFMLRMSCFIGMSLRILQARSREFGDILQGKTRSSYYWQAGLVLTSLSVLLALH